MRIRSFLSACMGFAMSVQVAGAAESAPIAPITTPMEAGRVARTDAEWTQMLPFAEPVGAEPGACDSPHLIKQVPSLDGKSVYQQVCRWVTSDFIVKVRVADGQRTAMGPGNSLSVIRDGPKRGMLLVERHMYRRGGGSYDATYTVNSAGHATMMVPGSDADSGEAAVARWLASNKWHAW